MARTTKPQYETARGRSVQELVEALRDGRMSEADALTGEELERLEQSGLLTDEEVERLRDLVQGPGREES